MSSIQILHMPPGSLVFMQGITVDTEEGMDQVMAAIRRAAGHDQFAVITDDGDGEVEVWGDDVDILARLAEHGIVPRCPATTLMGIGGSHLVQPLRCTLRAGHEPAEAHTFDFERT